MKEKIFKFIQENKEIFKEEAECFNLDIFSEELITSIVLDSTYTSGWPRTSDGYDTEPFDIENNEIEYHDDYIHINCGGDWQYPIDFKLIFNPTSNRHVFLAVDIVFDPSKEIDDGTYVEIEEYKLKEEEKIFIKNLKSKSILEIKKECLNWPMVGVLNPIELDPSNCTINFCPHMIDGFINNETCKIISLNPKFEFYIWHVDELKKYGDSGLIAIDVKTDYEYPEL